MNNEPFDIASPVNFIDFIKRMFNASDFMPHGHCYFWRADIMWLNVVSDAIIALSYYSIPLSLIYLVLKRRDVPFNWLFIMFGAFIFLCGTTHVMDVLTVWVPAYRLDGTIKFLTAVVSITTALLLIPSLPKMMSYPSLEATNQILSQKTKELESVNKDLERFNRASVGREQRIIELKKEVNQLAKELGKESPYEMV